MQRFPLLALVALVCVACSDFPAGGQTIDEREYGPVGTIVMEIDSTTYSTSTAVARKTSPSMDGSIVETLGGPRGKLYLTMEFRVVGSQLQQRNLVVRLGEIDSTARFYRWEERDPSLRIDLLHYVDGVIFGSFSGWLYGTGSATYGSRILVERGTMHVRFLQDSESSGR